MGCSSPNSIYSKQSTENKELVKYERSLNIHTIPVHELELQVRRCQLKDVNQYIQIINSCFQLRLPDGLLAGSKVGYEDVLVFFILLGAGSPVQKLKALWHAFDPSFSQEISKKSLGLMINAVIKASVIFTLRLFSELNKSTLIISWQQQLSERMESLETKLTQHFLAEKETISFTDFMKKCQEMPQGRIYESHAIRTQLEHTQVIPKRFANPFLTMKIKSLNI